jgi:hypothetical protein
LRRLFLLLFLALSACNPLASSSPTPSSNEQEALLTQAIRHYYEVFDQVRANGDASLINAVTDPDGVDRSNVLAFVADQRAKHRLSVITADIFSKWKFAVHGSQATVSFDHQISGYDIDSTTRQPIESPTTLPPDRIAMELRLHDTRWLVFNRQVVPNAS